MHCTAMHRIAEQRSAPHRRATQRDVRKQFDYSVSIEIVELLFFRRIVVILFFYV